MHLFTRTCAYVSTHGLHHFVGTVRCCSTITATLQNRASSNIHTAELACWPKVALVQSSVGSEKYWHTCTHALHRRDDTQSALSSSTSRRQCFGCGEYVKGAGLVAVFLGGHSRPRHLNAGSWSLWCYPCRMQMSFHIPSCMSAHMHVVMSLSMPIHRCARVHPLQRGLALGGRRGI